jgi:hypothetical protein
VAALGLDAPDGEHRLAPDADHVRAQREREHRRVGQAEPSAADEHDVLGHAGFGERAEDAQEAELPRQRDVVGERQRRGAAPVPASAPSMVTKSGPPPVARIRTASWSQDSWRPTADLMLTGSPVSAAISSANAMSSSTLPSAAPG